MASQFRVQAVATRPRATTTTGLLSEAARTGDVDTVKRLLDNVADATLINSMFIVASKNGHTEIVKYLFEHGADIHTNYEEALISAATSNHLLVVQFLVQNGANVRAQEDAALISASARGYLSIVKFLVEHGAHVHARGDEVLTNAKKYNNTEIVNYIENILPFVPLIEAITQGDYVEIKSLAKDYYDENDSSIYSDYTLLIFEAASMDVLQFIINSFYYQAGFIQTDDIEKVLGTLTSPEKKAYLTRVLTDVTPYVDIQKFDDIVPPDFPETPEQCQVLEVVLGGTTGARLVQCGSEDYVMKKADVITKSGFIYNEYLANQIYRLLGVDVPDVRFYTNRSTATLLSKYIDRARPLKKSMRTSVGVYVVYKGYVLVHKRSSQLGGFISSPGGGVDADDPSLKHAAVRELREEAGLYIEESDLQLLYDDAPQFVGFAYIIDRLPVVRGPESASLWEVDMNYTFDDFNPKEVLVLPNTGHAFVSIIALEEYLGRQPPIYNQRYFVSVVKYLATRQVPDPEISVVEKIRQGFVADAFLANWDVLGRVYDNVLVKDGVPYRIDNGGALFFRAKGGMKPVSQFSNVVVELDTMRTMYPGGSNNTIFGPLTNDDIHKQIAFYVPKIENDVMPRIKSEVLRRVLGGRLEYLKKWSTLRNVAPTISQKAKKIGDEITKYTKFFKRQMAYLTTLPLNTRQLVGEYIQLQQATDINDILCSEGVERLSFYQYRVYTMLMDAFYGVPPIHKPLVVYRGISVPADEFRDERLKCQFVSTSTSKEVAEFNFADSDRDMDSVVLKITIQPGSKVLPLYGYFKDTTLTSYEEVRETFDREMEVLLHPDGTWVQGDRSLRGSITYINYTYSDRL